jgi:5-methylcytosine-specific restriction enzyme subunit McrC
MGVVAEQVEKPSIDLDGYIGRIPVRNLWLPMLYASDLFRTRRIGNVGLEDSPDDLSDLVGEILAHAVEVRQRRRLSLGYRSRNAIRNRVRGRIDVLNTERHLLLDRGLVACRFDEWTIDTPRNRFVRAALESISRIVRRQDVSHRCRSLASVMKAMGVSGDAPTRAQMSTDRFGRNDAGDRFMVAAAKLAFDLALPTEAAGMSVLTRPDREVTWVRRLFEKAVGGFYDVVLQPQGWHVRCGGTLSWQIEQKTLGIDRILPTMRTDVVLDHAPSGRRIVSVWRTTSFAWPARAGMIAPWFAIPGRCVSESRGGRQAAEDPAPGWRCWRRPAWGWGRATYRRTGCGRMASALRYCGSRAAMSAGVLAKGRRSNR